MRASSPQLLSCFFIDFSNFNVTLPRQDVLFRQENPINSVIAYMAWVADALVR